MTIRTAVAGFATAFVLGSAALLSSSLATAGAAQAAPGGWHGSHGHGGHFGHGPYWGGHRPWGWRPAYFGGYAPACYTVLRARFVPGLGLVERPVTRCR